MYRHAAQTVSLFTVILIYGVLSVLHYSAQYQPGTTGYDVSWPNCKASIAKDAPFGIIGVTFGRNYTVSPCFVHEAAQFKTYQLYMNTGNVEYDTRHRSLTWPKQCTAADEQCISYNYGYGAAQYAVRQAALAGLHSPIWWLDVETENTWATDTKANVAALQGMIDAVKHETIHTRIGIYAYPGQWRTIMGDWRPDLPAWVATGSEKRTNALQACNQPSFTAGPVILTQYIETLDHDYVCRSL